nr:putative reverse transcriptase domain-containing protein [Tanacetum cinerariifolium]
MPPRVMTRSVGWPAIESLRGGTGVRVGRGGRPRKEGVNGNVEGANKGAPNFSMIIAQKLQNLLPALIAQVGGNQGNDGNQNGNMVNENAPENVRNVLVNSNRNVQDMSGCSIDHKVKYTAGLFVGKALTWWNSQISTLSQEVTNHAMVGAGHATYTDRFHELARLVPHLVTPKSWKIERYVYGLDLQIRGMVAATEPKTIQKAVQIFGALTDEAVSKGKNGRDDNKRTRTGNVFATTINPVGRENAELGPNDYRGVPRNMNPVNARNPPGRACYKCGSTDHVRPTCPRLNRAQGPEGNHPNQVAPNNRGQGHGNKGNQLGVGHSFWKQRSSPGSEHYDGDLGFRYKIELTSGQLAVINKVIKGCKLQIEGHVFDIDLIPFGHGSFDVIIGMDWLSNYKAEITCHEKVVRIPLPDENVLRVLGERPNEKAIFLMGVKKQEEIVVVRDFPEVFPNDLSGLPPIREIEFQIELIPGATPIAKCPYRLAPSEMEDLSGQLKELHDKELNKLTVKNRYPLPKIDDLFDQLQRYVVPTGRVVVPTGRYVVLAGNVIIVSSGRLSLIPTGRVLSPDISFYKKESLLCLACDYISYSPSLTEVKPQMLNNNQTFNLRSLPLSQTTMQSFLIERRINMRTRSDHDGRVIILPPMIADEHIAVQRESMARTTLLQSVPDDHVADFHYTDDARDIWNAVKARFGGNAKSKKMRKSMLKHEFLEFRIGEAEGLHKGYDRMQKILSQLNLLKAKPEDEDINLKFLRLKTLEVDFKGYTTFSLSQSAGPSHSAFVSTIGASKKMSYGDSLSYSSTTTYTAPSNSTTGCHIFVNVIKDVLHSFVVDIEPEQQLAYEDFKQIEKLDLEEMDLKWQMAM